jgi:hypothetical protein
MDLNVISVVMMTLRTGPFEVRRGVLPVARALLGSGWY